MIHVQELQYTYPNQKTITFPNFSCEASQVMLVTGQSGVGKTTLLHLLSGLLVAESGQIRIDATEITQLSPKQMDAYRGQYIGVVLQQNYFIEALTVLENLEMGGYMATSHKQTQKAKALLTDLGLASQEHKYPHQLSVGQQQRLSIARAFMNSPKVVLADEPTSSLDDDNAFIVADMLAHIAKNHQTALIVVTHDSRLKQRFNHQIALV